MSTSNNRILSIYKSRSTILEILSDNLGYDTTDYEGFSINEIDAMSSNSQLDMLLKHSNSENKVYVKYYSNAKQIRPQNLYDIIEDLFVIENVLTKEDTLIVITEDEPNDTIITKLKYLYDHDGIFVVIHNIKRLQYNMLNHKLVPQCKILDLIHKHWQCVCVQEIYVNLNGIARQLCFIIIIGFVFKTKI
jgi:nitrate reductase NapAB chaperone NapD